MMEELASSEVDIYTQDMGPSFAQGRPHVAIRDAIGEVDSVDGRPGEAATVAQGLVIAKFAGRLGNAGVVDEQVEEWADVSYSKVKREEI